MADRKVAIAIGVGDAKPLPYLGGAINGARAFHEWASRLGYDSKLVVDENKAVTLERLRSEFERALAPESGPIHRLVVYFAGHGLIREAEEGLWLLSDWNKELRAVAVESLKRRLYMHDIQQIAIFADSCRSLPSNIEAADLAADPVLGRGPNRSQKPPQIDKFIAAQDGSATFMVPGAAPEEDRCLFSGVLMEALWGTKPDAFSAVVKNKITSRSLGKYLESEVPKVAKRYKCDLVPSVSPTFPEGDDIYFPEGVPPKPPSFPTWPKPSEIGAVGRLGDVLYQTEISRSPDRVRFAGKRSAKPSVKKKAEGRLLKVKVARGPDETRAFAERSAQSLLKKIENQKRPDAFETGAGFAVDGGVIRGFWVPADVFAERHGDLNWWRIREKRGPILLRSAPVLIEFTDGMFAATAALPGFIATVLRAEKGVAALIYRPKHMPKETARVAEKALAEMESGALRADAATDLAVDLRRMKHVDPVLGVISAYLYDSIGDFESIRRMAFYYVKHRQPIPYDIALLAQLQGGLRDGRLWAKVPAVSERKPRTQAERQNQWTYSKTHEVSGEVGGLWPWMRQGWTFLDDPADDGSTLIVPGLIELTDDLAPARFATFSANGGKRLAEIFKLSRQAEDDRGKSQSWPTTRSRKR